MKDECRILISEHPTSNIEGSTSNDEVASLRLFINSVEYLVQRSMFDVHLFIGVDNIPSDAVLQKTVDPIDTANKNPFDGSELLPSLDGH